MLRAHSFDPHSARVIALYPDGWHAFAIASGTTFGELARRLEELDDAHHGAIIDVKVRFDMRSRQQIGRQCCGTGFDRDTDCAGEAKLH